MKLWFLTCLFLFPYIGSLPDRLQDKMLEIAKEHPEASFSFYVYDLSSQKTLYDFHSQHNLAPASALKALTTASALEILGADFRFKTGMAYSGTVDQGVLNGNIHILPSGDPTFGSKYFNTDVPSKPLFSSWTEELKKQGIHRVSGKVILEMGRFELERVPPKWSFEDLGNYFGASLAPLNCYDNRVYLTFKSAGAGTKTTLLSIEPNVPDLKYKNEVVAASIKYDDAYVFGAPRQYNQMLRGRIPANRSTFQIKASVPEPELFYAQQLVKALRDSGIEVPYGAVSSNHAVSKTQYTYELNPMFSPTLSEIVKVTNIESNNLFAEALVKAISLNQKGFWSRETGLKHIHDFWQTQGIDLSSANLYDGSGLTRYNGISAKALTEVMTYMWQSPNRGTFYESLPIAGRSGSLANMFKGSNAENNLRAKSGYLAKVRSYTGYTRTATGKVAAFTLMINNYNENSTSVKTQMEALLRMLSD